MTGSTDISFQKANEMTENALSEVNRLAMEQIRRGAEISSHIEAAERDLRGVLRQLVLSERDPAHRVDGAAPPGTPEPLTRAPRDPRSAIEHGAHARDLLSPRSRLSG
jgi:hypothetical protein